MPSYFYSLAVISFEPIQFPIDGSTVWKILSELFLSTSATSFYSHSFQMIYEVMPDPDDFLLETTKIGPIFKLKDLLTEIELRYMYNYYHNEPH